MKYIPFFLLFITISFSQIEKELFFINPNVSFSQQNKTSKFLNTIDTDRKSLTLRNQLGYFISNNIAIGANINYRYVLEKLEMKDNGSLAFNPPDSKSSQSVIQIGPFIRYYHTVIDGLQLYIHLEYLFEQSVFEESNGYTTDINETTDQKNFYCGLGLAFFVSSQSSVDLSVLYSYQNEEIENSVYRIESGFITAIGYSFYFTLD